MWKIFAGDHPFDPTDLIYCHLARDVGKEFQYTRASGQADS
jgi:hypothetical protein